VCGNTLVANVELLPVIGVWSSYGNGWRQLWKHFLMLFLIGIISGLISSPSHVLSHVEVVKVIGERIGGAGVAAALSLSFAYGLLLTKPVAYGVSFAYLKAARNDPLDIKDMFEAFKNYRNVVLASLLVGVIVGIGFVFLIVPGIIFACKFAFTPYLVVDRKMKVIDAVEESWRMTRGHAWKVFLVGLLGVPIALVGLMFCGVGIIIAIMWNKSAFASLYHAVSSSVHAPVQEGVTAT
jgi:uncharacterized membrane protein